MIDLIYLILCLLSIININIKGKNSFFNDYMDVESANSVKGIFVWMIFFRHFTGYLKNNKKINRTSFLINRAFGQNIVSLFLFYSGYGINESFKKKGKYYIRTLPKKSLILFIKFQISLLIYLINNIILGIKTSLKSYLFALILKTGIGNSFWFTFTIIALYIYSYFSFNFTNKSNLCSIIILNIICCLHMIIVFEYYHKNQIISIDTIFCFIIGLYYSLFKFYLDQFIMKNDINYYLVLFIFILFYHYFYMGERKHIFNIVLKNGTFTFISILTTMKIKFKNEFLNLLTSHSYSIYILQRIVMIHIWKKGFFKDNEFIQFFFEFIFVILLALLFDKYTNSIDELMKHKNIQNKKKFNKVIIREEFSLKHEFHNNQY